jgi:predicted CoA-substrate-specific enzyme activase
MLVAGIDSGSETTKVVILEDSKVVAEALTLTGAIIKVAAEKAMEMALSQAKKSMSDLAYIISTGYGRHAIPFANKAITEITCHAEGAHYRIPAARTIIDIGGQDSKVIKLNEAGNVVDFAMNDKCAAGTGRFLEVMAETLETKIDDFGGLSLRSNSPCSISSTCTVFAETEVISLRAEGRTKEDLAAGLHRAASSRIITMGGGKNALRKEIILTGGVAKNIGMKRALETIAETEIVVPPQAQLIGALGAALIARGKINKNM